MAPCAGREAHPDWIAAGADPAASLSHAQPMAVEDRSVPRADRLLGQHRAWFGTILPRYAAVLDDHRLAEVLDS